MGLNELNITTFITQDVFPNKIYNKLKYLIRNFYIYKSKKEQKDQHNNNSNENSNFNKIKSNSNNNSNNSTNSIKIISPDELKLLPPTIPSDIFLEQINLYNIAIIHYSNT